MRLYLKDRLDTLHKLCVTIAHTLLDRARREADLPMPGYTHLQRAQPVLLAHHLLAYHEMFMRDCERLASCYTRVNRLPLGAGA